jgi:prepilin-type N-terminal cleavage/methylation domain-containing protein
VLSSLYREVSILKQVLGFTLIELMVVLSIIGGIIALGMPYLSNRNAKVHSMLREMSIMSRELHTRAKLQGAVYRLVIDLGNEADGEKAVQKYWIEKANGGTVVKVNEEEQAMQRAKETDEKKRVDPRGFEEDHTILHQPKELPPGLRFEKVELTRSKNPIVHGKAYIHYMPQGLTDEAAIHIKGEKDQAWTIAIHPLTGKAEVMAKPTSLKEISSQ